MPRKVAFAHLILIEVEDPSQIGFVQAWNKD